MLNNKLAEKRSLLQKATERTQKGLTLVELLITLSVVAILVTLAVPSYQDFINRNTVENIQHRFAAAIVTARSEAASRGKVVSICPSSDGTTCANGKWDEGWIVFVDDNETGVTQGNGVREPASTTGEELILSYTNTTDYLVDVYTEALAATNAYSFDSRGYSFDNSRAIAVLCAPNKKAEYTRSLTIERSGRVLRSKGVIAQVDNEGTANVKTIACT